MTKAPKVTASSPSPVARPSHPIRACQRMEDAGDATHVEQYRAAADITPPKRSKTQKAVKTVRAVAKRAETKPEKENADRAMAQVGRIEEKAEKRPKLTTAEQSAEFEKVAREHGAEGDERSFNDALRKLSKPKSAAR